jgi:hypothetical protein
VRPDVLRASGRSSGPRTPQHSARCARGEQRPAGPGRHSAKLRRAAQRQPGGSWLVRGQRRTHGHISFPHTTPQCALRPRRAPTCRARGRNPASAAEGTIPGIRAWNCSTSTICGLQSQRAVPGRPPRPAAAGRPAPGAENRDEPWGPLGDAKWIFKPGAAFVTSSTISTRALKPKYEHRKNAPNLWAPHRERGHGASSTLEDPRARREQCTMYVEGVRGARTSEKRLT